MNLVVMKLENVNHLKKVNQNVYVMKECNENVNHLKNLLYKAIHDLWKSFSDVPSYFLSFPRK